MVNLKGRKTPVLFSLLVIGILSVAAASVSARSDEANTVQKNTDHVENSLSATICDGQSWPNYSNSCLAYIVARSELKKANEVTVEILNSNDDRMIISFQNKKQVDN